MKLFREQVIFTLLLCSSMLWAQGEQIFFERITTREGLSQNDINGIYQDSRGFMWFGTHEGLNRYDGYSFTVYKPDPTKDGTINSNLAFAITEDSQSDLWIGTTGSGINHFDRKREFFTPYMHRPGEPNSLTSNHIICLHVDEQDLLWAGTNNGLDFLDLNKKENGFRHVSFSGLPSSENKLYVNTIFDDRKGNIWVGTNYGLWKIDDSNENTRLEAQLVPITNLDKYERVLSVQADKFGALIIATRQGLFYQTEKGARNTFVNFYDDTFRSIQIDDKNRIWAGSETGLYCFKSMHNSSVPVFVAKYVNDPIDPNSLSKDVIRTIYTDQTGIIWVGTNGGGINKFFPEGKPFRVFRKSKDQNSLSYNKIRTLFEDSNGTLWIGTEGGGLNILPTQNDDQHYRQFIHQPFPSKIFALEEIVLNKQKTLLIGAEGQMNFSKLNIENSNHTDFVHQAVPIPEVDGFVFSLLEDSRGMVWIGTYQNGLYCWTPGATDETKEWRNFQHNPSNPESLSNNIVRKIYEDSKGNIWVGTGHGLNKLSVEEVAAVQPSFIRFLQDPADTNSISHNYMLDIYEGSDKQLWIGTFGGGINQLDLNEEQARFVSFGEQEGLPNGVIKSIQEDEDGHLWIATNKGLSRFDPRQGTFINYDEQDGLQSSEFSEIASLRRNSGEILFGGINGFNSFYPDQIHENKHLPEVVICQLLISNKPVGVGQKLKGRVILPRAISELDELKLKFSQNSFSIEFAALHFAAPDKNKYAYKLDGFDPDWVYTGADKRFATYTNLSPGTYTLLVKASNNDGLWNETPRTLKIRIIPPIWLRWYAYLAYFLLIIGFMLLFRKYTIIGIHEKHQLTLEKIKNEKMEEVSKMKLQFFTNISHELRTPLTLIKGPLDNLLQDETFGQLPGVPQKLHLMQRNANYLLRLVNQLLDFRKLDQGKMTLSLRQGEITNFIGDVVEPFLFLARKKNIQFEIDKPAEKVMLWFDPDILEKVLYNLLSNAFKFTPENGRISVQMATVFQYKKSLLKKAPLQHYFELKVVDTGPGIEPDQIKHIFERFNRGKHKHDKSGAGIGLAYTKSLVALHQGEIEVLSRKGKGACFIIKLPLDQEVYDSSSFSKLSLSEHQPLEEPASYMSLEDQLTEKAPVLSSAPVPFNEGLPIVLIVDDNTEIRKFLRQGLREDFRIIEAENGRKGYENALSLLPDIIISDVMMPELNGLELCTKLKSDERTSHIPVILLTAKSAQESELEGIKSRADAYIRKPFNLKILKSKMTNIIQFRDGLKKRFRKELLLEPGEITVTSADESFLQRIMEIIEDHLDDPGLSVDFLSKEMGISRSKLYLKNKALTGQSANEIIRSVRLKRAVQLLEKGDYSVKEIMSMTGFNTPSYFSKCFKKQFGIVPSEYLNQVK